MTLLPALRVLLVLVGALLAGAVTGCDLQDLVLQSEIAPSVRDDLVRDCCECLSVSQTYLRGDACSSEDLPDTSDPDGGPIEINPCLCGVSAQACSDILIAGGTVDVVGGCTAVGGMCHARCDGVLAYP